MYVKKIAPWLIFHLRADHVMLPWRDGKVLFCGGWREDAEGERRLVDTVDVYTPEDDAWEVETTVPTPRYHAGIALVGDRIYVVGGLKGSSGFDDRATGE